MRQAFVRLARQLDPEGVFTNDFVERYVVATG
jgi:hypothetical protein